MKKLLIVSFMFCLLFLAACASDDDEAMLGNPCSAEGEEVCSADGQAILVCRNYLWQQKKSCNISYGEYCRETADGELSCDGKDNNPDTGDTSDSDTSDSDISDSDTSDSDISNTGITDTDSNDTDDSDTTDSDNNDTTPEQPDTGDTSDTDTSNTDITNTDITDSDNTDTGDSGADTGDSGADTGDTGADTGDTGADTGDSGADTGDTGADTGDTGTDTGDSGADTGDTGADTGDTGADTGDTGADTGDSGADTGDTGADTGDTGADTGDTGTDELHECSADPATPCKAAGLIWSSKSDSASNWSGAVSGCESWREGEFTSGWRLPKISELRKIITNCSLTETGGSCHVTDTCLAFSGASCYIANNCYYVYETCPNYYEHSPFGETGKLWSASTVSDFTMNAWWVDFSFGAISAANKETSNDNQIYYRCVHSIE